VNRSEALISQCGRYRYYLHRVFGDYAEHPDMAVFVMLNPSTADAEQDDATIRKCCGFARLWGKAGIIVVNLFAWRARAPYDLIRAAARGEDVEGGDHNANSMLGCVYQAPLVVAAWGAHVAHKSLEQRARDARKKLRRFVPSVSVLGLTKDGHPRHPLYVPYSTELEPWQP
jgi:hypothetical protein